MTTSTESSKWRWSSGLAVLVVAVTVQCLGPTSLSAQTVIDKKSEYNVKAVYLYSFGRYVTWPDAAFPSQQANFVIGVCGEDPFGTALQRIARAKTIQGRKIELRSVTDREQCVGCHILFMSGSLAVAKRKELLDGLQKEPVLLVGDQPDFALRGGVIGFVIQNNTVRFQINVGAAKARHLSIDGKLLSLAKIVGSAK